MRQYKYELICFRTAFCFVNISAPEYRTEMVLYSKFAYGSQFSGEKNNLKIRYLVAEILIKQTCSFFYTRCRRLKIIRKELKGLLIRELRKAFKAESDL